MFLNLASQQAVAAGSWAVDQRSHSRDAVELDLRYKVSWRGRVLHEGARKPGGLSSRGIFFRIERRLPRGLPAERSIDWPMPLEGTFQLQLRIAGRSVRSSHAGTAVRIALPEFCTRCHGSATASTAPRSGL